MVIAQSGSGVVMVVTGNDLRYGSNLIAGHQT